MKLFEVKYKVFDTENMQLVAAKSHGDAVTKLERYVYIDEITGTKDCGDIEGCGYTMSGVLVDEAVEVY